MSDYANRDPESAERPAGEKPKTEPPPPNLSPDANERPGVQGHSATLEGGWAAVEAMASLVKEADDVICNLGAIEPTFH